MKYRKCLVLLLLAVLVATIPSVAESVSSMPAPTGYIDDYAGVLSEPAKAEMEGISRELHDKTKAQVFLVTIKSLEDEPVEAFANGLFAKWKIGEKKTDRGVLILFAINDHKRWIEIGYGLEGILNDAKVGDIGRQMVPALQSKNYDEATKLGLTEITRVIAADSNVTLDTLSPSADVPNATPSPPVEAAPSSAIGDYWGLAFPIVWFVLIFAFIIWRIKKGASHGPTDYSSSSSNSSFGDNSSFSSSSSSSDFSGGDGGSSGGGGAGGDW